MRLLVLSGATAPFELLIELILSEEVLQSVYDAGVTELRVQYGMAEAMYEKCRQRLRQRLDDQLDKDAPEWAAVDISGFGLTSKIADEIQAADLVVSHAGTGSILDSLRAGKRLLTVVNPDLMDNHQRQIADRLAAYQYLVSFVPLKREDDKMALGASIQALLGAPIRPLPPPQSTKLANLIDTVAGIV
ncbi:glycosyltransferase family 1 protein [Tortispora caseinolytica NRRL Y-17796]|uniref:UDP-N-acetylglucosamine transferase subunit ALG13 n=1 Tax=Tortispora caseinolytica NRRL Y-17796 TaxID=767744 RepID=A0A1E4TAD8_9ASCO|nr:glycosyltransferase family 1 protein [Tortispora caseinolytica NRRL Y-17796]